MFVFSQFRKLLAKAGFDSFLLGLIGMIVLAYFLPSPGVYEGAFSLSQIANYGVSAIFFLYGLRLTPEKLKVGLSNWKLHTTIQLATFLLFPLLVLLGMFLFSNSGNYLAWLSVFYLASLPSTVSSSVVMVSIAKGNIPAAIFNASISSLIGVFITPLWMGIFLSAGSSNYELWGIIGKLTLQVIVPVTLGIVLNQYWGWFAEKHRKTLRYFDQTIILLIVYTSFCESFAHHMFAGYKLTDIALLGVSMIGLFFFIYGIIHLISKAMHFNREDRITALFCGSKKSLVQGSVMAKVLFPDSAVAGVVLLSVMIYHALQLIAASIIAQSMAKQ
ncbi:MAG TPA: bile acid:sodium symporter family protein [Bacteroidales bacterium]|nr:bile acid:sodium symporter family protein [Bacteroidales bacterium]